MAELKPCPFCGETCAATQIDGNQGDKWGGVVCGCGAQGPEVRTGYDDSADAEWRQSAIEQWNTRPSAQAVAVDDAMMPFVADQLAGQLGEDSGHVETLLRKAFGLQAARLPIAGITHGTDEGGGDE